jgi:hypothetical protein
LEATVNQAAFKVSWSPKLSKFRVLRRKLRVYTRNLHPVLKIILEHLLDGILRFFEDHWIDAKVDAEINREVSSWPQADEPRPIIRELPSEVPGLPTFTITAPHNHDRTTQEGPSLNTY